jgi:hypothetical protein
MLKHNLHVIKLQGHFKLLNALGHLNVKARNIHFQIPVIANFLLNALGHLMLKHPHRPLQSSAANRLLNALGHLMLKHGDRHNS